MTRAWTYETAAAYWEAHRDNPAAVWDRFEAAEEFLLDLAPRTPIEAARIVSVLVDQGGDRRTDGRDVEALERLRTFLRALDGATKTPTFRRARPPARRRRADGGLRPGTPA